MSRCRLQLLLIVVSVTIGAVAGRGPRRRSEEQLSSSGVIGVSNHSQATTILVMGDSISACYPLKGQASYRRRLWERVLESSAVDGNSERRAPFSDCVTFVGKAQGVKGEPTPRTRNACAVTSKKHHMPNQFDAWWARSAKTMANLIAPKYIKMPPNLALVLAGVNDLVLEGAGVEDVLLSLRSIVRLFNSVETKVLLGTVLTIETSKITTGRYVQVFKDAQPKIRKLNKILRSYRGVFPPVNSGDEGLPFTLVDVTSGFDAKAMTLSDGIHLNDLGEDHIGDAFFSALVPLIEQRSFECLGIAKREAPPSTPSEGGVDRKSQIKVATRVEILPPEAAQTFSKDQPPVNQVPVMGRPEGVSANDVVLLCGILLILIACAKWVRKF